jgi:hypothetical protein
MGGSMLFPMLRTWPALPARNLQLLLLLLLRPLEAVTSCCCVACWVYGCGGRGCSGGGGSGRSSACLPRLHSRCRRGYSFNGRRLRESFPPADASRRC